MPENGPFRIHRLGTDFYCVVSCDADGLDIFWATHDDIEEWPTREEAAKFMFDIIKHRPYLSGALEVVSRD